MKNDLLNALLHVSMNSSPVNSKEVDDLITRVVDKYVKDRHYKVPTIYSAVTTIKFVVNANGKCNKYS